jgi:hypothetical protein
MKVPRSEAEAYRLLLLTIGYFALIVAASWINRWLGLAVFVVLTLAVLWRSFGRRDEPPPTRHVEHRSEEGEQRILVLANETVQGGALREAIAQKSAGRRAHVLVVTPALNSPLRHWASDEDGARANAELRQAASLRALERLGVEARARSGTRIRCRRSTMPAAPSAPTRSSSRPIRRVARTGSSRTSWSEPARASTSPSPTWSSISPRRPSKSATQTEPP